MPGRAAGAGAYAALDSPVDLSALFTRILQEKEQAERLHSASWRFAWGEERSGDGGDSSGSSSGSSGSSSGSSGSSSGGHSRNPSGGGGGGHSRNPSGGSSNGSSGLIGGGGVRVGVRVVEA
jgi:hypothetical protein